MDVETTVELQGQFSFLLVSSLAKEMTSSGHSFVALGPPCFFVVYIAGDYKYGRWCPLSHRKGPPSGDTTALSGER